MDDFTSAYLKRKSELEEEKKSGVFSSPIPLPTYSPSIRLPQRTGETNKTGGSKQTGANFKRNLSSYTSEKRVPNLENRLKIASVNEAYQDGFYRSVVNSPDFSAYSIRPESQRDTAIKNMSNGEADERYLVGLEHANGVGSMEWIQRAGQLKDEELAVYNYIRNKEGQDNADKYLDYMEETLNQRLGGKQAEDIANIENPLLGGLAAGGYGLLSGVDQFGSGVRQLFSEEALPATYTQFGAAQVRENLADAGPKLPEWMGGRSLGQAAFEGAQTLGNMLPSIAVGSVAGGAGLPAWAAKLAGAGTMAASAGGNAYNEAVKQGYTPEQAQGYGTLVALSEGGLSYLLGGISALGGKVSGSIISKTVQNIDNALLRAGAELGLNMLSEGGEEYLQEILTPVFRNIALDEDNPVELVSEDAIYAGIMGALTAGLLEGPSQISSAVSDIRTDSAIDRAYSDMQKSGIFGRSPLTLPTAGDIGRYGTTAADAWYSRNQPYSYDETAQPRQSPASERTESATLTQDDITELNKIFSKAEAVQDSVPTLQREQVTAQKNASTGEAGTHRMTMEDFTDINSPVWNNVEYGDTETQSRITRQTHQAMVEEGAVVTVPEGAREQVGQSYPDLRGMKKTERTPILRQKMKELKASLRQFLNGLKGGTYEFEVNGNILEAKLYDTGVREVLEKIDRSKASMLYHSDQVFRNARYLYSTPDYDGDPNVYRWNYFYTPVQIGDEIVGVRIAVRDMVPSADGKMDSQIYNWGIKTGAALDGGRPGNNPNTAGVSSATPMDAALDGGGRGQTRISSDVSSAAPDGMTLGTSASSVNPSISSIPQSGGENNPARAGTASGPRPLTLPGGETPAGDVRGLVLPGGESGQGGGLTPPRAGESVDTAVERTYDRDTAETVPTDWEISPDGAPVYAGTRAEAHIQPTDLRALRKRQRETAQRLGMSRTEASRLEKYIHGFLCYEFNRRMEHGTLSEGEQAMAADIAQALRRFPRFEGRSYRNLQFRSQADYDAFLAKHTKGARVTWRAFTSTSKRPNGYPLFGDGVVHLVVDGRSGRDIADTYGMPRQQEVTYLPGTELTVTKVTTANDGKALIYMEEVTDGGELGEADGGDYGNGGPAKGLYRAGDAGTPGTASPDAVGGKGGGVYGAAQRGRGRDGLLPGRGAGADAGHVLVDNGPESSVGAARWGFDPYSNLINRYGAIEPGENPARVVDAPRKTGEREKVSLTARTVMEAAATPDAFVPEIAQSLVDGKFSYIPVSNEARAEKAARKIERTGYADALKSWGSSVRGGKASADLVAMGAQLYNAAVNAGDTKQAMEILYDYTSLIRQSAQATQAARILKTLTPEGRLYLLQKEVNSLNDSLSERQLKKLYKAGEENGISIDENMADAYLNAKTAEEQQAAYDALVKDVAGKIPSTFADKWNAWRYMSMLVNPRTHIRNMVGNLFWQPVRIAKDRVAAAIEVGVSAATGGKLERTKSFAYAPGLYKAAWADWANVKDALGGGKYSDLSGQLNDQRTIFKNKALETVRSTNSNLLELEDAIFKRITYADALAGFLHANGVTAEQLSAGQVDGALLERARSYAGKEALKATYQDKNAFSNLLASRFSGKNGVERATNMVVDAVLPFRRTPANILVRGVEYSPIGLAKSLFYDLGKVKAGKMSGAEAIDNIAAGLTGSALMALGALLAGAGLVSGAEDDDKQKAMDNLTGRQEYALSLPGGGSVTLDWLAPESLPFFMGVELAESLGENGVTADGITDALSSVSEPMLEMSMLQSLNDLIDSVSYVDSSGKIVAMAASVLISYFNQAVPTFFGQVERTLEDTRMTTYTDKNLPIPTDIQYALGKASAKIPGWDYQQIPYTDAWGREEENGPLPLRAFNNFLNPAYTSRENVTQLDAEMQRLYDATGDGVVIPKRAEKSIKVDDETINLSADQYDKYNRTRGQTANQILEALIALPSYQSMSDGQKREAFQSVYEYATDVAKMEVSDFKPDGKTAKILKSGVPADLYMVYSATADANDDDNVSQVESAAALLPIAGLTDEQKGKIWQSQNTAWGEKKNPFTGALPKAGIDPETSIDILQKYSEIDNDSYSGDSVARQKQTALSKYLDTLDLSEKERSVVDDTYVFFNMFPASVIPYNLDTMSDAAQEKWPRAERMGYSEEEYVKYYPICAAGGKKKTEIIQDLINAGMTRQEALQFWNIVK